MHYNINFNFLFRSPDKWSSRVTFHLQEWTKLYTDWLTNYQGPILVVFYENLINDTRNELKRILNFLNVTVSEVHFDAHELLYISSWMDGDYLIYTVCIWVFKL